MQGGCGTVMRDHHGDFLAGECRFLPTVADPERAELLACRQALRLARRLQVPKLILESDCLGAFAKIRSEEKDRSSHGPLVEEIKELVRCFDDILIRHTKRTGNGVVHTLAHDGWSMKRNHIWKGSPPGCIASMVASAYAG